MGHGLLALYFFISHCYVGKSHSNGFIKIQMWVAHFQKKGFKIGTWAALLLMGDVGYNTILGHDTKVLKIGLTEIFLFGDHSRPDFYQSRNYMLKQSMGIKNFNIYYVRLPCW